jgi:hypothetical protein
MGMPPDVLHQIRADPHALRDTNETEGNIMKDQRRRYGSSSAALRFTALLLLGTGLVSVAAADISLPPVTVGAGIQTSLYSCDKGCIYSSGTANPGSDTVQGAELDSIRLYINGTVTDHIKLTFDTEYDGGTNQVGVLDAIARFEFSDTVNFWAGRFLPPTDRANLYGPYYANDWAPYADGVADFYPDVKTGRDNGAAYWGQFGIVKVQAGLFDGGSLNSAVPDKSKLLYAGRIMADFWDAEPGYYLNGTYYGEKDLLSLGLVGQSQDGRVAWDLDGLMEKKLPNLGVFSVEAEFQKDNGLTATAHNKGWYALSSYLFPQVIGVGKFQVLGKYSQKTIDSTAVFDEEPTLSDKVKTAEVNLNYIIKAFNARVGLYALDQKDEVADLTKKEFGLKLQLQL